jgi:hypothetical protein
MKLKSFGCSFIWGSELADNVANPAIPSTSTWPALLAKKLDVDYQCFARGGIGNLVIAERILTQSIMPPSLFVINWTYIDRFDYKKSDGLWSSICPNSPGEHGRYYYQNLHSQYQDKLVSLMYIKLCIDQLTHCGHKFIMTYMDDLLFETQWHITPTIKALQSYIRPHLYTFDNFNFLKYSQLGGYKIGKKNHPLEDAHQACFEYANTNFLKEVK